MANSDRDIRIVPDRGAATQPVMYFTGADSLSSATIVLRVLNSSTDATLSFEGDVGQLFSITDSTFGPVFSVNDISGIPSIEVLDSGLVKLAEYNGKVQVGGATNNENATSTTTGELQVIGGVGVSRDVYVGGGMTVVGTLNAAVIAGSISNSANVTVTNDASNSAVQYLTFVSGTSGNLPIKVDNNSLTFRPSTNSLGIGTTNPYSRLSLVSSANTEGISLFTSTYEAGRQWGTRIWKNDTGAGIPLQIDTQQTTTWYTTIRMGHGQDNNNPALITYYNTQLAMTSGNVGVGITPTNKLHVSGDAKIAGTLVGLRNYQSGDDFRIDFVKAANDTASARFEWNGYSSASQHLIDHFSIGLNDASSAMQTRFQIMQDGRIGLNTTDFSYTSSDNTAVVAGGIDANKVFVNGSIQLLGNNNAIVFGRGTSTFIKDEEIGFGWGGGWYMTDATYLRSRNNKHVYNEAEFSGSKFQGFSTSYNKESFLVPRWNDNDWAFGIASNDSTFYWLQGRYYGDGTNNRGFRIKNSNGGGIVFSVNEKIIATQNTIYRTFQNYTGTGNTPMKTWDGVLIAGSDTVGASTYTVIETNVPQDSYMMGGFSIEWFENYSSTNGKTTITLSGYWNAESNGGFVGWEYTSSNPNIVPTIQVGRNTSNGKTVIILTHFSANYAIVVARDLWLGYSGGDYDYGSGWSISQTSSLAAYSNLDTVVARVAQPAGSGSGSGLNADLLDGIDSTGFVFNGTTTNGTININGGTGNGANDATVYITATNNNDWGLIINKNNSSATEYGQDIRVGSGATYALRIQGSGSETFRVNGAGSVYAPIYYDRNDNTYYGDFASTSRLNQLNMTGRLYVDNPLDYASTAVTGLTNAPVSSRLYDPSVGTTAQFLPFTHQTALYSSGYRTHVSTGIYKDASAWNAGWYMAIGGNDSYPTEWFQLRHGGTITHSQGYVNVGGSVRTPIVYDLDNTAYYVDPNGTSNVSGDFRINQSGSSGIRLLSTTGTQSLWIRTGWDQAPTPSVSFNNVQFQSSGSSGGSFTFYSGNTLALTITSDYAQGAGSLRAPIFYDSNDTNYYVDPAGTSRFNIINANTFNASGGAIVLPQNPTGQAHASVATQPTYYIGQTNGDNDGWKIYGESPSGTNTGALILQSEDDYDSNESIRLRFKRTAAPFQTTDSLIAYYNYVQAADSFRAPIFYDSNNTAYYGDFASTTVSANLAGAVRAGNGTLAAPAYTFGGDTNTGMYWRAADEIGFSTGGNDEFRIYNTYTLSPGSSRAPIFYDSDDTAFYLSPNTGIANGSTSAGSRVNDLRVGSIWRDLPAHSGPILTYTLTSGGTGYVNGSYTNSVLSGGQGVYATFDFTVAGGVVTVATLTERGSGFQVGNTIAIPALGGAGSGGLITVNSVRTVDLSLYNTAARIRLASNDTSLALNQEIGGIYFNARDASVGGAGDKAFILGVAEGTSGGGKIQFWTSANGASPTLCGEFAGSNNFRLYNTAGTFYHEFTNAPTANRVLTLPDATGTIALTTNNVASATVLATARTISLAGDATGSTSFNGSANVSITVAVVDDSHSHSFNNLLNKTSGTATYQTSGDFRAPIFYDSNNTGYYADLAGTTTSVNQLGNTVYNQYGRGPTGLYSASRLQLLFSMGSAYQLAADGTTAGNLYGVAWSHPNAGAIGGANNLASHGMLILENGSFRGAWGGGRLVTTSDIRGTLFYDYNDTGYYVDPASTSNLNAARLVGNFTINNGSPTIYLQDTDNISAMIHQNSNLFYILRGSGVNSTSWATVNGYWPAYWDMTNNNATFGGSLWCAGEVTAYSDARLKENIVTIDSALEKTLKLRGVYFNKLNDETKTRKVGVVAQEIQEVLPEVVQLHQDKEDPDGTLSVSYGNITGLLIEAIKEQQKIIEEQGKRISALENLINKSN